MVVAAGRQGGERGRVHKQRRQHGHGGSRMAGIGEGGTERQIMVQVRGGLGFSIFELIYFRSAFVVTSTTLESS